MLSILLSVLFLSGAYVVYAINFAPYSNIPGPRCAKISRIWLSLLEIRLQRNERIYDWHKKYGPIVLIAPGEVSFSNAYSTREIYGTAGRHPKSTYFDHFITQGARPLFSTLGYDEHQRVRRLISPYFQATSIYKDSHIVPIRSRVRAFVEQVDKDIESRGTLDMFARLSLFAFDNITRLIFGKQFCSSTIEQPCEERAMLQGLRQCQMWNNLLFTFPLGYRIVRWAVRYLRNNPDFLAAEQRLSDWIKERLALANGGTSTDTNDSFLRTLKEAKPRIEKTLSSDWVSAEVVDNIHAGQITVTVALTYVLWNIARSPDWQQRIRQEIGRLPLQDDGMPSFTDVDRSRVLDACVRESFRVNPLSSGRAERVVPVAKSYEGVYLPRGTIVSVSAIAIHHTPSVFPDPHIYDPNRWLKAGAEELSVMERHYMPFGYGARFCLGKAFATVEIKMLIACLLVRHELSEDQSSLTNVRSMKQSSTQDALPIGGRCDLLVTRLDETVDTVCKNQTAAAQRV